jgi:ABC-2 type transport system permease protein
MLAIYKKELRSYFTSMIGYVFIAIFLIIVGIWFFAQNLSSGDAKFEDTLAAISFLTIMLTPILTMRLMAEENKQKTDQLLLTSPLGAGSIVVGKLLAVITIFGAGLAVTCLYPLILSKFGIVHFGATYAGILGFLLLGAAYLSMGLYISSLTESQVVAAVISFIVFIFTLVMDSLASIIPSGNQTAFGVFTVILIIICFVLYRMMHNTTLSVAVGIIAEAALLVVYVIKPSIFDGSVVALFGWLSVYRRYNQFGYGILDISGLIYYLSIIILFAFLSTQVIRKKRWS